MKRLAIDISSLTYRKRFADQQKKNKKAYFYALNIKAQVVSLFHRKLHVTDNRQVHVVRGIIGNQGKIAKNQSGKI